ncbi:MAG: molybdopterin molybdotransferase MoeA [Parvularculaceae bacterium]|nr:molybdopterin molybdotransferase MoeA [Parvularculaceae bacterium]
MNMLRVDEARALIVAATRSLDSEMVRLESAAGRVLSEPVRARLTQPPFDASAMDGYAVRLADCRAGARLRVVGEAAAGRRFSGQVVPGCAVRIFTGGALPPGADHVLIQEDADRDGKNVIVRNPPSGPQNIRHAGLDFRSGDLLADAGAELSGPLLALLAAGGVREVAVRRRPRVALIANGDELVLPGVMPEEDGIVCSIPFGLAPMIESWGGAADFLGIAKDDPHDIGAFIDKAREFDLIVPIGGASVGDRDFMRAAFEAKGLSPIFQKVALKPGKPAWFGALGAAFVLGLPGNPASALIGARLFLKPAIRALLGAPAGETYLRARAGDALPANGARETYLRAALWAGEDGVWIATPFSVQDSSVLSVLARSGVLIRRAIDAAKVEKGALIECVKF